MSVFQSRLQAGNASRWASIWEENMATRANVEIIHEARFGDPGEWNLCFQWVRYHYTDGSDSD